MSHADQAVYVDLLLTALARGGATSVVLTAGAPLPDPAALTTDARQLASITLARPPLETLSAEKVIQRLLEAAGFRRFHLNRTEGRLRTSLEAHDGASAIDVDFDVKKRATADGRVEIEIAPVGA